MKKLILSILIFSFIFFYSCNNSKNDNTSIRVIMPSASRKTIELYKDISFEVELLKGDNVIEKRPAKNGDCIVFDDISTGEYTVNVFGIDETTGLRNIVAEGGETKNVTGGSTTDFKITVNKLCDKQVTFKHETEIINGKYRHRLSIPLPDNLKIADGCTFVVTFIGANEKQFEKLQYQMINYETLNNFNDQFNESLNLKFYEGDYKQIRLPFNMVKTTRNGIKLNGIQLFYDDEYKQDEVWNDVRVGIHVFTEPNVLFFKKGRAYDNQGNPLDSIYRHEVSIKLPIESVNTGDVYNFSFNGKQNLADRITPIPYDQDPEKGYYNELIDVSDGTATFHLFNTDSAPIVLQMNFDSNHDNPNRIYMILIMSEYNGNQITNLLEDLYIMNFSLETKKD